MNSALRALRADSPSFIETDPQAFHDAITAATQSNPYNAAVEVKDLSEYAKEGEYRLFITEDGSAGFALSKSGDIVSLFKDASRGPKSVRFSALSLAIDEGGRTLKCFDTELPKFYSQLGFRAISQINWAGKYKPEGWDFKFFKEFNGGRPDIVLMVWDPYYHGRYLPGEGKLAATSDNVDEHWKEAVGIRRAFISRNKLAPNPKKAKDAKILMQSDSSLAGRHSQKNPKVKFVQ